MLCSAQKFIEILDATRRSHRRADLRKAVCKTDAKLCPTWDAGALEDRRDFDGALLQVFLPGITRHIPQFVDIPASDGAHGNHRFIPSDEHIPQLIRAKTLEGIQVEDIAIYDAFRATRTACF